MVKTATNQNGDTKTANIDMLIATGSSNIGGYCIGLLHACPPTRCTRTSC